MERRSKERQRQHRCAHTVSRMHLPDKMKVSIATCRIGLQDKTLGDVERLLLLVMIADGTGEMTLAELKTEMSVQMLEAGGMEEAIERLMRRHAYPSGRPAPARG